jgi:hypothetical protein
VPLVDDFFRELDAHRGAPPQTKIRLRIIGSSALMLQTDYERGTKDSDVLETNDLTSPVKQRILELGGAGSELHTRHRLYIELVSSGIPFLPQVPVYHRLAALNALLRCFELVALVVIDVVVAMLKRFHANDRGDIEAMVKRDIVPHERLLSRFRAAVDHFSCDARADDLPRYVKNLHVVERDFLTVAESEVELPEWIGG